MDAFERVKQIHNDTAVAWAALEAARKAAGEISNAVISRIEAEQEQVESRIAILEAEQADMERSQTLRRVGAMELETLRNREFSATQAETEAFIKEISNAEQALMALKDLRESFHMAIGSASAELKHIRADILGNPSIDLAPRWLQSEREKFARINSKSYDEL